MKEIVRDRWTDGRAALDKTPLTTVERCIPTTTRLGASIIEMILNHCRAYIRENDQNSELPGDHNILFSSACFASRDFTNSIRYFESIIMHGV